MSRIDDMISLVEKLQVLAKAEWGEEYLDCDCAHECACDCYMCKQGWYLTDYLEIHSWEEKLLPIVTAREPRKLRK